VATEREEEVIKSARAVLETVETIERDNFEVHVMRRQAGNRFERDVTLSNKLNSRLSDLEAAVEDLDSIPAEPTAPTEAPPGVAVEGVEPSDESRVSIQTFFESISHSLSEAQKTLDDHSAEYLQGIAGKDYLPPAVFRLPRLKAQLKFAMREVTSSGFDIVVFTKRKEQEELQEQTIDFEMVSAPPAVEVVRDVDRMALQVRFVLLGPESRRLGTELGAWLEAHGSRASDRDRALITQFERDRANVIAFKPLHSKAVWLLARYPRPNGEPRLGLWRFDPEAEPTTLSSLIDRGGGDEDPLIAALAPVFDRQRRLLERHRALSAVLGE
jgi:hypothetical protein